MLERGHQQPGQREVSEHVGAELQFKSIARLLALRRCHHAGVVDQEIEGETLVEFTRRHLAHGVQGRQVQYYQLQVCARRVRQDPRHRGLATALVPAGQ